MILYVCIAEPSESPSRVTAPLPSHVAGLSFEVRSDGRMYARCEAPVARALQNEGPNGFRSVPVKSVAWLRDTAENPEYPWSEEAAQIHGTRFEAVIGLKPDFGELTV